VEPAQATGATLATLARQQRVEPATWERAARRKRAAWRVRRGAAQLSEVNRWVVAVVLVVQVARVRVARVRVARVRVARVRVAEVAWAAARVLAVPVAVLGQAAVRGSSVRRKA
jgi:hypothetical protein